MPETELERIKGLEVTACNQQRQIEDHEKRIDALEEVSVVVGKLNDVVSRQGENIDKLSQNTNSSIKELSQNTNTAIKELMSVINDMKKTTEQLGIAQAKIEVNQKYWFIDGILTIFKKIGVKGFIAIGSMIAAILTALHILG